MQKKILGHERLFNNHLCTANHLEFGPSKQAGLAKGHGRQRFGQPLSTLSSLSFISVDHFLKSATEFAAAKATSAFSFLRPLSTTVAKLFEAKILGIPVIIVPIAALMCILFINFVVTSGKIKTALKKESSGQNKSGRFLGSFSVLASCVGGALGMGNIIAGCVSVKLYGPGILFWIIMVAIIISASKFFEVSISCRQSYAPRILSFSKTPANNLAPQANQGNNTKSARDLSNQTFSGPLLYIKDAFRGKRQKSEQNGTTIGSLLAGVFAGLFGFGYLLISIIQANQFVTILPSHNSGHRIGFLVATLMGLMVLFFILKNMKEIAIFSLVFVPAMLLIQLYICIKIVFISPYTFNEIWRMILADAFNGATAPAGILIAYAIQRMILATDVGTGISGMLSSESQVKTRIKQGLLSGLEPILTGVVVFLVGIAVISGGQEARNLEGMSMITSQIKSGYDIFLFGASIFMFAITTIVTRSYCAIKSFLFIAKGRLFAFFAAITVVGIALSPFMSFTSILALTDAMLVLAATINLVAILVLSIKGREEANQEVGNQTNQTEANQTEDSGATN